MRISAFSNSACFKAAMFILCLKNSKKICLNRVLTVSLSCVCLIISGIWENWREGWWNWKILWLSKRPHRCDKSPNFWWVYYRVVCPSPSSFSAATNNDQISQGEFVELADLNPARLLEPRRQDRTTLSSWSEILSIYRSLDQGLL